MRCFAALLVRIRYGQPERIPMLNLLPRCTDQYTTSTKHGPWSPQPPTEEIDMNTVLKVGALALVFSGVASSSALAACLGEPSQWVLTCQSACCDSLKTACTNGGATYTPTKG